MMGMHALTPFGQAGRSHRGGAAALGLVALFARPSLALAHDGAATRDIGALWHADPLVLLGLLLGGGLYAAGVARLWRRVGAGRGVRRWQAASFAIGLALLAVALVSPLAGLAEALFSAHMAQHLLLLLAAPPLLLLGAPQRAVPLALPRAWRRPLAVVPHRLTHHPLGRMLGALGVVWLIQLAALWLWHLPALYEAALRSEALHALEHVTFVATALLFWGVVFRPFGVRRAGYGAAIVFVIATALPNGLLGALMTLTPVPWYPAYAASAVDWGLTPLVDQQLAGLLMWIPPGLVYVGLVAALLLAWLERGKAPLPPPPSPLPPRAGVRALTLTTTLASALVLAACVQTASPRPGIIEQERIVPGGDPLVGRALLIDYNCMTCHLIPGIRGPETYVGPPLTAWAKHEYIAGNLPNTSENLVAWIVNPQAIESGTVMPTLGVSEAEARDMAAYLYLPDDEMERIVPLWER